MDCGFLNGERGGGYGVFMINMIFSSSDIGWSRIFGFVGEIDRENGKREKGGGLLSSYVVFLLV